MLKKLKVKNYKSFKNELVFDFSDFRDYKFNTYAIKDNLIKAGIIYGKNGSGKSNFGLALFDLTIHLIDRNQSAYQFTGYLNGDSDEDVATFTYEFIFDGESVIYEYKKSDAKKLTYESLTVNDKKVFSYNFLNHKADWGGLNLVNVEKLNIKENMNLSVLRYIRHNTNINDQNIIYKLMNFVDKMLWFRTTTDRNEYIGYQKSSEGVVNSIIENNKVADLQSFLKDNDVYLDLEILQNPIGQNLIVANYKHNKFDLLEVASHGTKALLLYYYWIQKLDQASFVFIDEFDAFFHTFIAQDLFGKLVRKISAQMLITTHNTDLLSNNILRPDCYFLISGNKIKSLPNCTERELREGHNLEKLFKAGEFGVE